jgi:tetratricopeptide (TPR) repeat protein
MGADTVVELERAVEKSRAQAGEDPSHLAELAAALTALGIAYNAGARYPDAVALTEEAVDTWRLVVDENGGHRSELAEALTTLGSYYRVIGLDEEADEAAEEARVTRQGRE